MRYRLQRHESGPDHVDARGESVELLVPEVEIDDDGINSGFRAEGVGETKGTSLKNPVTGEEHGVAIDLAAGFIWKRGDCGQGSFHVEAEGITLDFTDSNWILYDFDWTNQE